MTPADFVVPHVYREVAQMLFEQQGRRERPIRRSFSTAFTDSEEQREVASLFNATIHLENRQENSSRAFADALLRIKEESLTEQNRTWDPYGHGRACRRLSQSKKRTGRPWKKDASSCIFLSN